MENHICLLHETYTKQIGGSSDVDVPVGAGRCYPVPVDETTQLGDELTLSSMTTMGIDIIGKEIHFPEVEPYIYACVLGEGEKRTSNPQDGELLIDLGGAMDSLLNKSAPGTSTDLGGNQERVRGYGEDPLMEMSVTKKRKKVPEHLQCLLPTDGELSPEQLNQVEDLLIEYEDIFIGQNGKVGYTDLVKHHIDTGGAPPKHSVAP